MLMKARFQLSKVELNCKILHKKLNYESYDNYQKDLSFQEYQFVDLDEYDTE